MSSADLSTAVHTEEAIVQDFLAPLAAGFPGALGLRDDCAVAAPTPGHEFVFKTDAIAAGIHFLANDPPADIGWKALAVNVSDLAAKGARPVAYLLSLAFPEAPQRQWLAGFAAGLGAAQQAFQIHLMGGDTDRRPGPISITPAVVGEVPAGRMVRRTTARAGDIAFVSGTLGDAALGLMMCQNADNAVRWALSDEQTLALIERYRRPQPRLALAPLLLQHARAAMDLSDGLVKDLRRMCAASGVGATIEHPLLPLSDAFSSVRAIDAAVCTRALFAGDDYEILAAVPEAEADRFQAGARAVGVPVTAVGRFIRSQDVVLLAADGSPIAVGHSGWDHF